MLRKLFFIFARYSGLNFLYEHFSDKKVFIIGYHSVSPEPSKVSILPDLFEKQIKFLVSHGHNFIKFEDLPKIENSHLKKPTIIYFDDGFKDNILTALPILKKYNVPATFFIVPKFMDSVGEIYMNWGDIRELKKQGMEIGSHTYNHTVLTEAGEDVLKEELVSSEERIEKEIGQNIEVFSYPKGRVNTQTAEAVGKAGYQYAITTRYGVNSFGYISKNPYLLKKIAPRVYENLADFRVRLYSFNIFR